MPAPLLWRSKILLFKIETAYGTDPTPTPVANGVLATDVKLQPMEGTDVNRDLDLPYLGAQGTIPNELHAKLSFKVEMAPSGTAGTAPAWGPVLRACGVAQVVNAGTSVVSVWWGEARSGPGGGKGGDLGGVAGRVIRIGPGSWRR